MKKLLLTVVCGLSMLVGTAGAATSTGTASPSHPFDVAFSTSSVGDVSASATWQPKGSARYSLTLRHLLNPADKFSYDLICQAYQNQSGQYVVVSNDPSFFGSSTPGAASCGLTNGPAGAWLAEFTTSVGKVTVALTTP
jgi:hypothetical protein